MNPQSLFCPNSACPATGQTAQAGHGQSQPPRCCGSDLPRGHPPSGPEGTPARGVTTRDHQLKQGLCTALSLRHQALYTHPCIDYAQGYAVTGAIRPERTVWRRRWR